MRQHNYRQSNKNKYRTCDANYNDSRDSIYEYGITFAR